MPVALRAAPDHRAVEHVELIKRAGAPASRQILRCGTASRAVQNSGGLSHRTTHHRSEIFRDWHGRVRSRRQRHIVAAVHAKARADGRHSPEPIFRIAAIRRRAPVRAAQ